MNNIPLLSIIIPCFNSGKFISKTLDMLIAQDLSECEVLIINDGSTDDTKNIVSEYEKNNTKIRLINQENSGVSVARNIGIQNATGKYVYFLDSDDSLTDGSLDFFREMLNEHFDCQWFGFGWKMITTKGTQSKVPNAKFDNLELDRALLTQSVLNKTLCVHICSTIYERNMIVQNKINFTPNVKTAEDLEFMFKVYSHVQKAFYSSRITFVYLRRVDSATGVYANYSLTRFTGFKLLKNVLINDFYYSEQIKPYSNFYQQVNLISHTKNYLKSDFKNQEVTDILITECDVLKQKTIFAFNKYFFAIIVAKVIPLKTVLRLFKSTKR